MIGVWVWLRFMGKSEPYVWESILDKRPGCAGHCKVRSWTPKCLATALCEPELVSFRVISPVLGSARHPSVSEARSDGLRM